MTVAQWLLGDVASGTCGFGRHYDTERWAEKRAIRERLLQRLEQALKVAAVDEDEDEIELSGASLTGVTDGDASWKALVMCTTREVGLFALVPCSPSC